MGVAISSMQTLQSGAGVYALSGAVACTTSAKSVVLIQDSGYRDCLFEFTFSGAYLAADFSQGSRSNFAIIMDSVTVLNLRIGTVQAVDKPLGPTYATVQLFVPRNSAIRVEQTDIDTTGSCTTMMRGYFLEPPVAQQA